jgi:hypothetical protein
MQLEKAAEMQRLYKKFVRLTLMKLTTVFILLPWFKVFLKSHLNIYSKIQNILISDTEVHPEIFIVSA